MRPLESLQNGSRFGTERHLRHHPAVVLCALVTGLGSPYRTINSAPGADSPNALHDEARRAQVELDRFRRGWSLLQAVMTLGQKEQAVDDFLRLLDHRLHEILGGEGSRLHEQRPEALARTYGP